MLYVFVTLTRDLLNILRSPVSVKSPGTLCKIMYSPGPALTHHLNTTCGQPQIYIRVHRDCV